MHETTCTPVRGMSIVGFLWVPVHKLHLSPLKRCMRASGSSVAHVLSSDSAHPSVKPFNIMKGMLTVARYRRYREDTGTTVTSSSISYPT